MLSLSLCLFAILLSMSAAWAAGGRAWEPAPLTTATHMLRVCSATVVPAKTPQSHYQHVYCWSQKLAGGEWFKEQRNQAWPGLATEPCRLHPFTSLTIPVPCPCPCLACLHCTDTSALLEIASPTAEFKAGQSSTIKKRISMVPDNIHCKKLTLLQWEHLNISLPDLRQCCTGVDCFLKTAKKKVLCPKLIAFN